MPLLILQISQISSHISAITSGQLKTLITLYGYFTALFNIRALFFLQFLKRILFQHR